MNILFYILPRKKKVGREKEKEVGESHVMTMHCDVMVVEWFVSERELSCFRDFTRYFFTTRLKLNGNGR